jgi:hypothetical protein
LPQVSAPARLRKQNSGRGAGLFRVGRYTRPDYLFSFAMALTNAGVRYIPALVLAESITCFGPRTGAANLHPGQRSRDGIGNLEPVMKKALPKSDGSSFLLCEDVREEVNNKLTIIGVFPNDDIVLRKDVLIPSLMAVLFARGGQGPCETRVSLTDPEGKTVIESPKQSVVLEKNKVHLAAVRVLAPELTVGQYTIKFLFDEVPIQRSFKVNKE